MKTDKGLEVAKPPAAKIPSRQEWRIGSIKRGKVPLHTNNDTQGAEEIEENQESLQAEAMEKYQSRKAIRDREKRGCKVALEPDPLWYDTG